MTTKKRPEILIPATSEPSELQRLLKAEPDLVDRIFDYLIERMPEIAGDPRIGEVEKAVRGDFGGLEAYVQKRAADALAKEVLVLFNGRNATEVARRLQISRATVYRCIKQAGGHR